MKVSLVMRPGSNLVRGGTEVMVDKTAEELRALGVEVDYVTPLTSELGDVVHFFGCFDSHWAVADYAIQNGIPIVWSPIYSTSNSVSAEGTRGFRKRLSRTFPRLTNKLQENAKRIVTLSEKEEQLVQAFFRIDKTRFRRIPHGVEPRFASGDPSVFRSEFGTETPFVLHVGMFTPGKNQLNLILALKETSIPLFFVGAPSDVDYYQVCLKHKSDTVRFLGTLGHEGPMLPSAYAAATVFTLPSHNEVFPLTALEAGVAGCALVLGNTWGAQGIYGDKALYVDPANPSMIRRGIESALAKGRNSAEVQQELLQTYSWRGVTERLKSVYEEAIAS